MPKARRMLSVPSKRSRVSPYPLRSSRSNKSETSKSFIDTEGWKLWEDVRCVICMEPPHNAVLLRCSSFSKGCHTYMCDTSARHSNCFKQYRRNNKSRLDPKIFNCPLCRGEVYETMKISDARRFMNAKPRSCSIEDCNFSGTYCQLKNHSKTDHPGIIPTKVNPIRQQTWEQIQRDAEYNDLMSAAGAPPQSPVLNQLPHTHAPHHQPEIRFTVGDIVHNHLTASQVNTRFLAFILPRMQRIVATLSRGGTP